MVNTAVDADVLIKAVAMHRCLWDKTCRDYTFLAEKNEAWLAVSKVCNATVDECKKKWKKMRDYYQRLRKVHATVRSKMTCNQTLGPHGAKLCFLDSALNSTPTGSRVYIPAGISESGNPTICRKNSSSLDTQSCCSGQLPSATVTSADASSEACHTSNGDQPTIKTEPYVCIDMVEPGEGENGALAELSQLPEASVGSADAWRPAVTAESSKPAGAVRKRPRKDHKPPQDPSVALLQYLVTDPEESFVRYVASEMRKMSDSRKLHFKRVIMELILCQPTEENE